MWHAKLKRNLCMCLFPLLPVSRNFQGRRGTTANISDNLLPSLMLLGHLLTAVKVYACPLFDVILPSILLSSAFPWCCALYDLFTEVTSLT